MPRVCVKYVEVAAGAFGAYHSLTSPGRASQGGSLSATRRKHTLSEVLGPLESEVMDVTWAAGEVTVRDVYETLNESRSVAYTTVMTTMGRLADKGLLKRVEEQRAHRFVPLVSREQYAQSAVKSVVDWLVTQFRDPAVAYFIDRVEEDDEKLIEALRDAIEQRREGQG
jgi:predicted transcriptional regulator